ncbi:lysine methyltransferase [Fragilaria crotonensis]|nr:lysine methyltransferase [Fragilaria crotonensis]
MTTEQVTDNATALPAPSMQQHPQIPMNQKDDDDKEVDKKESEDGVVDDYEYDDPNDPYLQMINFKSIRTSDGLEVAIQVQWLNDETTRLELSTLLEEGDMAPLFSGAQWAGTRVWHAAIAMVHYLTQNYSHELPTATLLELGCGLGVPGMLCHSLYGCDTYLSDQESIVSQLIHNVQHNFGSSNDDNDKNKNATSTIRALPLTWSRNDNLLHEIDFSIVINCDCIYEPLYGDSWKLLAQVLETILQRNPNALVLTSVERRNTDGVDTFLQCMEESPWVSNCTKVWSDVDFNIEIYQTHGVVVVVS